MQRHGGREDSARLGLTCQRLHGRHIRPEGQVAPRELHAPKGGAQGVHGGLALLLLPGLPLPDFGACVRDLAVHCCSRLLEGATWEENKSQGANLPLGLPRPWTTVDCSIALICPSRVGVCTRPKSSCSTAPAPALAHDHGVVLGA